MWPTSTVLLFPLCQVRSEIAEEDEEDEELNVKKVKSKQKDKYVLHCFGQDTKAFFLKHVLTLVTNSFVDNNP